MSKTSDDTGKVRWWPWLLGVIVLWILAIIVLPLCFPNIVERGQFGDSFGVVNALFSGLALAGVIYAIILQKKELALQREELEKTREEIKGQKEQLEAQNQTLQKQNFESSFFQLLGLHNDIVNSMEISLGHTVYQGRQCFDYLLGVFRRNYRRAWKGFYAEWEENPDEAKELMLKWINDEYEELFDNYQSQVGYYFRNLYNVVKFVDQESDFPKDHKAKKPYTNLIRAQLSSDELGLLFYNCLSNRGAKFKKLVEKYALLEDMDFKKLIQERGEDYTETPDGEHKSLYDESAYGESK